MITLLEFATIVESDYWQEYCTISNYEKLSDDHVIVTYSLLYEEHLTYYERSHLIVELLDGFTDTYRLVRPYLNPHS